MGRQAGLAGNRLTRRKMADYFKSEYEAVRVTAAVDAVAYYPT